MMSKQHGFTLIEVLLVISIVTIMVAVTGVIQSRTHDKLQFERWYQQFDRDILFLQQQTMLTRTNDQFNIRPSTNSYEIRSSPLEAPSLQRDMPSEWEVSLLTLQMPLSFTRAGTIRNPGMFRIVTKHNRYDVYFPFGKGRSYFVKK